MARSARSRCCIRVGCISARGQVDSHLVISVVYLQMSYWHHCLPALESAVAKGICACCLSRGWYWLEYHYTNSFLGRVFLTWRSCFTKTLTQLHTCTSTVHVCRQQAGQCLLGRYLHACANSSFHNIGRMILQPALLLVAGILLGPVKSSAFRLRPHHSEMY